MIYYFELTIFPLLPPRPSSPSLLPFSPPSNKTPRCARRLDRVDPPVRQPNVVLHLAHRAPVLVHRVTAREPGGQGNGDERHGDPGQEDAAVHAQLVLRVENDRADSLLC